MTATLPPAVVSQPSAGLSGVGRAVGRAVVSQFHPRMLMALLLPFVVALAGAVVLIWAFWEPLSAWLNQTLFAFGVVNQVDQWITTIGIASLKLWLIPVAATVILLPLSGILGLTVAAVVVMPLVLRHVSANNYPEVVRRGSNNLVGGTWNAIWVTTLFVLGWLVTLPLWLLPPFAIVLPILWWTFAFTRMLRVDALAEHASKDERQILESRHNRGFWTLGLICALINLFPPAWLLIPVLSALMFSHFGLEALRRLRSETQV